MRKSKLISTCFQYEGCKVKVEVVNGAFEHHSNEIIGFIGYGKINNYYDCKDWWIIEEKTRTYFILKDYIVKSIELFKKG